MEYGFSVMGFLFVVFLLLPSFYWVNLPDYDRYRSEKQGIFQGIERIGLTASICIAMIFRNFNYQGFQFRLFFLILAWAALLLYELHWMVCVRRKIPPVSVGKLSMTVLSPAALVLLGIYGNAWWLVLTAVVYGIGHVGGKGRQPDENWHCCCGDSCEMRRNP